MYGFWLTICLAFTAFPTRSLQSGTNKTNPGRAVLPGLNAEPHIMVINDTYYLYPTQDGERWQQKTMYLWKSKNLINWVRSGDPIMSLDRKRGPGHSPWGSGKASAPCIFKDEDTWFFYYSGWNDREARVTIGAAAAREPEGPFAGVPNAMITGHERTRLNYAENMDPMVFQSPEDGQKYLFWGNGKSLRVKFNSDMITVDFDSIEENYGLLGYSGSPFIFQRYHIYHMVYSVGDPRGVDYSVGYATAPFPDGPWQFRYIVLEKNEAKGIVGTGSPSVVNTPGTDDWYMAYHRFAIPHGDGYNREVVIDRMEFDPKSNLLKPLRPTIDGVIGIATE